MAALAHRGDPRSPAEAHARLAASRRGAAEAAHRLALAEAEERRRAEAQRAARRAEEEAALARAIAEQDALVFQVLDPETLAREPKRIIARVAAAFGITSEVITGPSRRCEIVHARKAAIAAVKEAHPRYSLPRLGRLFRRDHTTILHHLRWMAEHGVPQPPAGRRVRARA